MYSITAEESFDSAHFLAGYAGKCSNIHGHRWRVVGEVGNHDLQKEGQCQGMVLDFSEVKTELKKLAEELDHCFIVEEGTLREQTLQCLQEDGFRIVMVSFRPTAENFSYHFYKRLCEIGFPIKRVLVYETPNHCAMYEEGGR